MRTTYMYGNSPEGLNPVDANHSGSCAMLPRSCVHPPVTKLILRSEVNAGAAVRDQRNDVGPEEAACYLS